MEVQTLVVSESELNELTTRQTITFTTSDGTTIPILNNDGTFTISDTNSRLSSPSYDDDDELSKQNEHSDELTSNDTTTSAVNIPLNVAEMMNNNDDDTEVLKSDHEVHLVTSHNYVHEMVTNNILASAYGMACFEEQEEEEDRNESDRASVEQRDTDGTRIYKTTATSSEVPTIEKENDSRASDVIETIDYLITEDSQEPDRQAIDSYQTELDTCIDPNPNNDDDEDGNANTVVIDVSNPIQLSQNSLITVNGQKCVLQQNVETGQLIAYPVREPTKPNRRRGRPRRKVEVEKPVTDKRDDVGVSVVEEKEEEPLEKGLVETANEAGEKVKRSARKRKTNRQYFSEYEVGKFKIEESEEEENAIENTIEDEELQPKKRGKYAKRGSRNIVKSHQEKRGRGRPRRYGLKAPSETPQQPPPTQAFLIQTVEGETIMMQVPMSSIPSGVSVQNVAQSIADSLSADKLQKLSEQSVEESLAPVISIPDDGAVATSSSSSDVTNLLSDLCVDTTLSLNVESTEKKSQHGTELQECCDTVPSIGKEPATIEVVNGDEQCLSSNNDDDVMTKAVALAAIRNHDPQSMETVFNDGSIVEEASVVNSTTVIPLPQDVMSFLISDTEEPVKIGLKASEDDLEKLLCSKCSFQAFFSNQYQEHLLLHENDTQKCKCCSFLTLREEELVQHYKACHPKNICEDCNHTAEYAYLVKRHKCRHNAMGSTCDICGKKYRDQYTLKMHIQNIHMPTDVLFECSVCSKKFNRKAHLKRHLRTHDPNKKYKCSHCDYRGCERSDITKHQLIHEAPKHVCEVCGQAFRHIKNKELHVKRHNGQRDYKCGECDFFGYTFTDIRKHIERKHTDIKTISCDKCEQTFKSEQLLTEHQLSEQCDTFQLEENLEETNSLNELAVGDEPLVDETNQLTSVTDADGITSITLTDESIATLNVLGGFTSPIMVSNEMGEQLSTSHVLETSDGQVTILNGFLDDEGNNHVAMVTADGQMIEGVIMDKEELRYSWKVTNE